MVINRNYPRSVRVAELIQSELGGMLLREVKDPRVRGTMITKVEVSRDLRVADVFFSRYGEGRGSEGEIDEGLEGLRRASGFLQGKLGERLRLRRVPRLEFYIDRGLGHSAEINRLLSDMERET
ncbi:MAG: 30S ribosome-binding factor RbfA [Nitrospinota bacterium]|jgi:ribosome-binding factor A|nr:30S ribosome-binding factor RbfA [Nitrospinota bacterium]MDP6365196.1 30S ribosome-binding factor RbfA [Nitrospinota bacterium]MDP7168836.1 30S ribosome-binding factor RbfA [Nitrospinota bacterium]MDP7370897.1 30S ribosome-binding factor RbfA [Nitrospinota bacterium]MDP7503674.1 30S ribosome-binding factor RbfA [Nitrospinota bacterium]